MSLWVWRGSSGDLLTPPPIRGPQAGIRPPAWGAFLQWVTDRPMQYGIKVVKRVDGQDSEFDDKWVAQYDPTYHWPNGVYDGGIFTVTTDPAEALSFSSPGEAAEKWRQPTGCTCHGIRPWDGKPNRPLTAFTVAIEPLPTSNLISIRTGRSWGT